MLLLQFLLSKMTADDKRFTVYYIKWPVQDALVINELLLKTRFYMYPQFINNAFNIWSSTHTKLMDDK